MNGDGLIFKLVALLRAAFLSLALSVGLFPQDAEAHTASAGSAVMGETQVVAAMDHGDDHSAAENAFGQCHPAIDCVPAAIVSDPARGLHLDHVATDRLRHFPLIRLGNGPAYEPPPPRSFN